MRYSLAYVAAALGSASASYVPAGYGAGGGEHGSPIPSISTGNAYPSPSSSSGLYHGPSSWPASYPYGGETASHYPSGTAPSYPPSGSISKPYPTETAPYPYTSSGHLPSKPYPTGTGNSPHQPSESVTYPYPSGTDINSHPPGTGTQYPHVPSGSGSVPPDDSGSVPPHGSGSVPPTGPITKPSFPISTVTHSTGTGTSTYTITHTGTTTVKQIITAFVPSSSPVGTASGSTYYSTSLAVSYRTSIITATTTQIEVVCPTNPAHPTLDVPDHNGAYVSASSGPDDNDAYVSPTGGPDDNDAYVSPTGAYGAVPTSNLDGQESPEYPASTVYGPGSKPTEGTCPPSATTVYSTVAVTVTAGAGGKPTACKKCSTYHVTLPNGQATDVVVPPADGQTDAPGHIETPSPPYPTGNSPHYPTGSGTGSYTPPTGTGSVIVPTGSESNGYSYRL